MREIKFRAWEKTSESMVYDVQNVSRKRIIGESACESFQEVVDSWEYETMQYTGLKDKNGKEIYEGDILLFNNDYPNAQKIDWKCVVKYRKGSFVCEYPKDGVYNHFDSWNVPKVTWEVIGNIYENPELIEGETK